MTDDRFAGCLLGGAVGDAIGLPYEGLSPRRALRLFGPPDRHRFLFGGGMISDDTEHACITANAIIASRGDVDLFRQRLAQGLKRWLLALPAGAGLATIRSVLRLWAGVPPGRSGVDSAGNGPVMRAPILGVWAPDLDVLQSFIRTSTRMTHSDPKAEYGAFAAALAARRAAGDETAKSKEIADEVERRFGEDAVDLVIRLRQASASVEAGESTESFAKGLGLEHGVSGFVNDCVPVAIHASLTHPTNFRDGVENIVRCGGDADSTAAILGGIIGARVGRKGIPATWLDGIWERPRSVQWMEQLAKRLADHASGDGNVRPLGLPAITLFARNLLFLAVVLAHGFRRLAPPY